MREIFTYGSVGGALGNQCFYPEAIRSLYATITGRCKDFFTYAPQHLLNFFQYAIDIATIYTISKALISVMLKCSVVLNV